MLEKLFHFLLGFARFTVTGDGARFLNMAARQGFSLWGFSRREGKASVCCRAGDYKRLVPIARRCGVRLRCERKGGLPFSLNRLKKRRGMAVGAICGICLYCYLSSFVWGVTVSGAVTVSRRQILAAAVESGVYPGAKKSGFTPKLAAYHVLSQIDKLNWASVNTDGCFVEVAVKEREQAPELTNDSVLSNIVAAREGTVIAIEAQQGRPEVSLGDTVETGDLLISGLYQEQLEPWDPRANDPYEAVGAARGKVTARTYREFTVQASATKRVRVPTGRRKKSGSLTLFHLRIPLGLQTVPAGDCLSYTETWTLTALGTPLPVSIRWDVYEWQEEKTITLDKEKLKEAALRKLREAQRAALPEGGKVLEEELSYSFPEGMCIVSARCWCQEDIGVTKEILVETPNSE